MSAGSANAFNMFVDRDIDQLMERTKGRPIVSGDISPRAALVFATVLGVASIAVLWLIANPLAALLSLAAIVFYVVVYTLLLKRRTEQNIVWGGIAGCFPVLIGWSAVTSHCPRRRGFYSSSFSRGPLPTTGPYPCATLTSTPQRRSRCCPSCDRDSRLVFKSCFTRGRPLLRHSYSSPPPIWVSFMSSSPSARARGSSSKRTGCTTRRPMGLTRPRCVFSTRAIPI